MVLAYNNPAPYDYIIYALKEGGLNGLVKELFFFTVRNRLNRYRVTWGDIEVLEETAMHSVLFR